MDESILARPTLKKHFAKSRLSERPLIVVEGKDDISFYDEISRIAEKNTKVTAIENISNYNEGCNGIEKLIVDIQEILEEEEINEKYFLAIIDADVRRYRNEEIDLKGLLTLKYYSYETHFITPFVASKLIKQLSSITNELVDNKLNSYLMNNFEEDALEKFYLHSIEALKNSIDNDYVGLLGYKIIPNSDPEKKVTCELILKNENLKDNIFAKEESLLIYANSLGLNNTYADLLKICKGKWILEYFMLKTIEKFNNAKNACIDKEITSCQYCIETSSDKCLYKPNVTLNKKYVMGLIFNFIDKDEVQYILDRFSTLN